MRKIPHARWALALLLVAGLAWNSAYISVAAGAPAANAPAKVDLNSATSAELEELPGIGEATAKKIIDNRPYKTVADLSKAGMSEARISKIEAMVSVGKPAPTAAPKPTAAKTPAAAGAAAKVDVNSATADELEELPGIGEATSKKIIDNRPYKTVADLSKAGLSEARIAKIEGLVSVGGKGAGPTVAKPVVKPVADPKEAPAAKVDLNTATAAELEDLPGVGEVTAKKIIDNRPYKAVDDLSKAGLSDAKIAKLEGLVMVSKKPVAAAGTVAKGNAPATPTVAKTPAAAGATAKVDLNKASSDELEELPGVGEVTAKKIIAGRPYKTIEDLTKAGVTEKQIAKFESLVTIGAAPVTPVARAGAKPADADTAKPASGKEEPTARTAPAEGMVWVNTDSGIYHKEGDQWYGKTKEGKFMTEAEAQKAGFRESK